MILFIHWIFVLCESSEAKEVKRFYLTNSLIFNHAEYENRGIKSVRHEWRFLLHSLLLDGDNYILTWI